MMHLKTTSRQMGLIIVLCGLCGCPGSQTEEQVSDPEQAPAVIELDNEPTRIRIRPAKSADPLPRLISTIEARGGKVSRNEAGITAIDWHHAKINNLDLELLSEIPTLRRLYLAGTRIDSRGWMYLSTLPNLERLALWRTPITDEDLQYLANAKHLEVLDLSQTRITGVGLAQLKDCQKLDTLILRQTRCENEALSHIAQLKSLRVLDLWGAAIEPSAISQLKTLPHLEDLRIYLYPEVLPHLAELPSVRKVSLTRSGFGHPMRNLEHLSKMKSLEIIEAEGDGVRDAFFEQVSQCSKLRELRIRAAARFTDQGLAHLIDCPSLRLLDMREANATPEGLRQIAKANPQVKILVYPIKLHGLHDAFRAMGLGAKHSRDGGPRVQLDREMNITSLRLEDARIFPQALQQIARSLDSEKLLHLGLGHTELTDEDFANFRAGVNLKSLNLARTKITAQGLETFGGGSYPELPFLESLDLSGTTLDEDCLAWISTLDRLQTLRLRDVKGVSDAGWANLRRLSNLKTLEK